MLFDLLKKNKVTRMCLRKIKQVLVYIWMKLCAYTTPLFFHQRKEIKAFQGIHQGQRCFIVATGPSLTISDLELIKDEMTFSVNSILNILDKTNYRPTYYVLQDGPLARKLKEALLGTNLEHVFLGIGNADGLRGNLSRWYTDRNLPGFHRFNLDLAYHIYEANYKDHANLKFSSNCADRIYDGCTVTYSTIQLAAYMGFTKIYLLGCDTNYSGHVGEKTKGPKSSEPAYSFIKAYEQAKAYADTHGIEIINCTRGGMLEVFPRQDLDAVIAEGL